VSIQNPIVVAISEKCRKIYLPHFCVRSGRSYEPLDYFRHLLAAVDLDHFQYQEISSDRWHLTKAIKESRDRFYRFTLGQTELENQYEKVTEEWEDDEQVLAWIVASLPFDHLSFKALRRIVHHVYRRLVDSHLAGSVEGNLALVKTVVRDKIALFIQEQLDQQTEAAFRELYVSGRLLFYLECAECRFQIPDKIKIKATRQMINDANQPMQRSLFDYMEDESHNTYERAVALALDKDENVLWWYRNLVGDDQFSIQGYRRHRIRPDFVVQDRGADKPSHRVLVIESKGKHLAGNEDLQGASRIDIRRCRPPSHLATAGRRVQRSYVSFSGLG